MIMISVLCMFSICSMNTEYVVAANVLSKNQKQSFNKAIEKFIKDEMIPDEEVKNVYFSLYDLDRDGKKEMIIENDNVPWGSGCVIDHNGKIMTIEDLKGKKRKFYFRNLCIYKKGVVMSSGVAPIGSYILWYKANTKGKLKQIASLEMNEDDDVFTIKGKRVSEKKYNNLIKEFSEVSNIKRYAYTKKNINKMFGQTANWKTAYRKFFDKNIVSWGEQTVALDKLEFAFVDIDQNGIPELILKNNDSASAYGFEHIYGYKDGKIIELHNGIYGNGITYNKKNKMICSSGGKMDAFYDCFYVIKNNRAVCIASRETIEEYDYYNNTFNKKITYYDREAWNNKAKKISKKQFEKLAKKGWNLDSSTKYKKGFTFKKVTKGNLKKYI